MIIRILKPVGRNPLAVPVQMTASKKLFEPSNNVEKLWNVRQVSTLGSSGTRRGYIPRRAMMYVPGNDDRKIEKIEKLGADCICLDCEDGVAFNAKAKARQNIRKIIADKKSSLFGRSEFTVRVNPASSGLLDGETLPDARVRVNAAWMKWWQVTGFLCDKKMPKYLKSKVYKSVVHPVALYGSECWPDTTKHEQSLHIMEMKMLRWSSGLTHLDRVMNSNIIKHLAVMGVAPIKEKM